MKIKQGTSAVVLGLGRSGMAAVRFLHHQGAKVSVSETRPETELPPADLNFLKSQRINLETGGHSDHFCHAADILVPSPGVPLNSPVLKTARKKGIPIVGELAIIASYIHVPIIAVTGTNGKTTVTSLIGDLLQAAGHNVFVGGNIGTPVFEYLLGSDDAEMLVLEVSSFQLEIAGDFHPQIALFLNLTADHLDRHGSMEQYLAAKQNIFAHQQEEDIAILGGDDPLVSGLLVSAGHRLQFGTGKDMQALIHDSDITLNLPDSGKEPAENYSLVDTNLNSRVNRLNAAAAILAARTFGCSPQSIRKGLRLFVPLVNRMEHVATIDGISFINDSKATNIGSMKAAIASVDGPLILIAGGRDKGCDFSELATVVHEKVKQVLLIGEATEKMDEVFRPGVTTEKMESLVAAVQRAKEIANQGDTVLLAPGCASFDMFANYAQRGEFFKQAVAELR